MKNQCSYISDLLRDALIIAWTIDHFKGARVTLELCCSDGSIATITETMDHLDDDTDNSEDPHRIHAVMGFNTGGRFLLQTPETLH
jgi:hypothetical protein